MMDTFKFIKRKNFKMGIFDFFKGDKSKGTNKANIVVQYDPPLLDANTHSLDLYKLSTRDQLVLLLISKTSISHPHTLMMRLDRHDFPANSGENLSNLVDN